MKDSKFLIIPMIFSDSPTYTALVYTPFSILFSQKITPIKDIFMQPSNLHLLVALICQEPLNVEGPKSWPSPTNVPPPTPAQQKIGYSTEYCKILHKRNYFVAKGSLSQYCNCRKGEGVQYQTSNVNKMNVRNVKKPSKAEEN